MKMKKNSKEGEGAEWKDRDQSVNQSIKEGASPSKLHEARSHSGGPKWPQELAV